MMSLKPLGVGVVIKATHHCMTARGVHEADTDLVTSRMLGCFRTNRRRGRSSSYYGRLDDRVLCCVTETMAEQNECDDAILDRGR